MTTELNKVQSYHDRRLTHFIEDDFDHYVTADLWTLVTDVDGTAVVADQVNGVIDILSAVVTTGDNEQTEINTSAQIFLAAADKPIYFAALIQYAEQSTDDANIFVGLTSVSGATALGDDGTGPPGTYDGFGFHKVDGGTVWVAETSFATTQDTDTLDGTTTLRNGRIVPAQTAGGASFVWLEAELTPISSTECDVKFVIDGIHVATHSNVTMTTPEEMDFVFAVSQGSTTAETLSVDYVFCGQTR